MMSKVTVEDLENQSELISRVETKTGMSLREIAEKIGLKEKTLYKARLKLVKLSDSVLKHLYVLGQGGDVTRLYDEGPFYQTRRNREETELLDQVEFIVQHSTDEHLRLFRSLVRSYYDEVVHLVRSEKSEQHTEEFARQL